MIVNEGIKLGQIKNGDAKIIASEIYGLISSTLVFKMKEQKKFDIINIYNVFETTIVKGLKQ